jgi:hypothetical protein
MVMPLITEKDEQGRSGKPLSGFLCSLEAHGGITASG